MNWRNKRSPPCKGGGWGGGTGRYQTARLCPGGGGVVVSRALSEEHSRASEGAASRYNPFASMYASTPRGTM